MAFNGLTTLSGAPTFSISGSTTLTLGAVSNGAHTVTLTGAGNFIQSGVWGSGSGGLTLDASFTGVATVAKIVPGTITLNGGTLIAKAGGGNNNGWTQTEFDNLRTSLSNSSSLGFDISNGNLDYDTGGSARTLASITRGTGGTVRFSQTAANQITVTSALSGLNVNGILPWAILKTGSTVDLAAGGAASSPITAYASYQTGAETTWANTVNARPAADQVLTVNRALGSLVLDTGIDVTGVPNTGKNLTIANGIIIQTGGSSTITPRNNTPGLAIGGSVIDTEGNLTLVGCNNDSMIAGSLTKTGPGTLFMGAADSFSSQQMSNGGDWYLNQGLVEYSRNGGNVNQGWGGNTLCFNGGCLAVHSATGSDGNGAKNRSLAFYADATFTLDNASTTAAAGTTTWLGSTNAAAHAVTFKPVTVTIAGGSHVSSGTAALVLGSANVANHTVTLSGTPTLCVTNPVAGGATALTLNGVIGDGGKGYGLTKTGNGTLLLNGTNSYTGTTAVNAGTLATGNASCFSDASSVAIAGGGAKLELAAGEETVYSLTLNGSARSPGVYGVGQKQASFFSGTGTLKVLSGPLTGGMVILLF